MTDELFETVPELPARHRQARSRAHSPDLAATSTAHDQNGQTHAADTSPGSNAEVAPETGGSGRAVVESGGNTPEALQLPASPEAQMMALIAHAASDPAVNVEKMKALFDLKERVEDRQREAEFNVAFVRLQRRLPRITKKGDIVYPPNPDAKTPAGKRGSKTKYARWEDIMEEINPILFEEGFALSYNAPPTPDGRVSVTATLLYENGWSRSSTFGPMPLDTSGGKNNLQAAGSSDSYGKRFATRDLLNLVYEGEDDDGVIGGAEYITDNQIAELEDLVAQSGRPLENFLRFMGVETLAEVQKSQFHIGGRALMGGKRRQEES